MLESVRLSIRVKLKKYKSPAPEELAILFMYRKSVWRATTKRAREITESEFVISEREQGGSSALRAYCGAQTLPTVQLRNGFAAPRTSK